ncbi:hypothetical protein NDU88_004971, partial [Pleurodeles waltl]
RGPRASGEAGPRWWPSAVLGVGAWGAAVPALLDLPESGPREDSEWARALLCCWALWWRSLRGRSGTGLLVGGAVGPRWPY